MVQTFGPPVADRLHCMLPCRVAGCVGLAVNTGVKRTPLSGRGAAEYRYTGSHRC